MPIQQDFTAYQESIASELRATQNSVRNLIGDRHWLTDGEHKEAILRNILRSRLPETVRVGKGFVCSSSTANLAGAATSQLDILITSKESATLYKDGELVIVTADAVEAIIEVKTSLTTRNHATRRRSSLPPKRDDLESALDKLATNVELIRKNAPLGRCWAGLFVYEGTNVDHRTLLETLQSVTHGVQNRAIDCISMGQNTFVHFWKKGKKQVGSPINGAVWHSYTIERLAPAYFVSNIAVRFSPNMPENAQQAWFPIENGKESRRRFYSSLRGRNVREF
jgi:hypothetical protein